MRICIYGAGAVGGHFAARLAQAGEDVSVIARGPYLDAIKQNYDDLRNQLAIVLQEPVPAKVKRPG